MPQVIDQEAVDKLNVMDINHPPLKSIPHAEFPKMVYAHPKDKTKEHKTKIVHNRDEEQAALKLGYKTKPHLPVVDSVELNPDEYETKPVA